jgi:hypothetical protein
MFADDTSIFTRSHDIIQLQRNLNSVIGEINEWFQKNQITLNLDNTFLIHFINIIIGNSEIQIKIETKNITTSNEVKFLGLIIDNKLSWKGHIEHITPKFNSACYYMRAVKPFVSQDTLKIIYYSYFYSIMAYALPFGDRRRALRFLNCKRKQLELSWDVKVISHAENCLPN